MENKKGIISVDVLVMPIFLKNILKKSGIKDIDTLTILTKQNLVSILEIEYRGYNGISEEELNLSVEYAYYEIVYALHEFGLTLKDEFMLLGLPKGMTEYSLTKSISDADLLDKLKNHKICMMGDLLSLNSDALAIIFNSDEFMKLETISNRLGFSFLRDFYAKQDSKKIN